MKAHIPHPRRSSKCPWHCQVSFQQAHPRSREAQDAVLAGAKELDMVINYHHLAANDTSAVLDDIVAVRAAAPAPTILKVIVETSQLSVNDIRSACELVVSAQADFIKTSTGFNGRGASLEDVQLMRQLVGENASVKASGGIRTLAGCRRMIEAGADRIGASAGVAIIKEFASGSGDAPTAAAAAGDGY